MQQAQPSISIAAEATTPEGDSATSSYIHTEISCAPRWVTQYSYPLDNDKEDRRAAHVMLRLDVPGDEPCCLDCVGTVESLGQSDPAESDTEAKYDCIDCGPALELVRDPLAFLRRARRLLQPGGELTASVANIRRESVVRDLIEGRWQAANGRGALRFFTRRELEKLLYRAGFRATANCPSVNDLAHHGNAERHRGRSLIGFDIRDRHVDQPPSAGAATPTTSAMHSRGRLCHMPVPTITGFECQNRSESWLPTSVQGRSARLVSTSSPPPFINGLPESEAEEFNVERYSVTATAEPKRHYGLTSIVIVTHNELGCTRACLASIRFVTDEAYELIVVDNGSTDGTVEYLRSCPDVKLIENRDNRGFPAAANQGIAASQGSQVLLLNNDVLVTTGWLRRMLQALHGDDAIAEDRKSKIENPKSRPGLVGPLTNCASGYQEIEVPYTDLACLDGFAWQHAQQHAGQWREVDRLIGFCLLVRREVFDQVGLLDERFGVGNFEDDDFCRRARDAGWRLVVAEDAFIHHFGHRTFDASGIDLNALLDRNRKIYEEKWDGAPAHRLAGSWGSGAVAPALVAGTGRHIARAIAADLQPATRAGATQPATRAGATDDRGISPIQAKAAPAALNFLCSLSPATCSLSLCMIVRDNERTIGAALESIRPWADEMIVVDTGSTDATPHICRELGAEVHHFPWPDSFAVARNESLKYAKGEWIFWMDSDDVIDANNGRKLRELVGSLPSFAIGLTCDSKGGFTSRSSRPSAARAAPSAGPTCSWFHAGSAETPEAKQQKLDRDLRLLQLELQDRPNHSFAHFNLGMTYEVGGRYVVSPGAGLPSFWPPGRGRTGLSRRAGRRRGAAFYQHRLGHSGIQNSP